MRIVLSQKMSESLKSRLGFLRRAQLEVFTGATTNDVLKIARRCQPAVVILDQSCRGLAAWLKKELASASGNTRPYVVMAVAAKDKMLADAMSEPGVDLFVDEPFDIKEVLRFFSIRLGIPLRLDERIALSMGLNSKMEDTNFPGDSLDLSESGMRMCTARELRLGETFTCVFRLEPEDDPMAMECEVVWRQRPVHSGSWTYGVRFVDPPQVARMRIREYVRCELEKMSEQTV